MTSREDAMTALLALLSKATGIRNTSRKLKLSPNVDKTQRPALILTSFKDKVERQGREGMPPIRTIEAEAWIYTDAGTAAVPAINQHALIESIETALRPLYPAEEQTLGGMVAHCWIEGEITKIPGDLDGDGLLIIPINVLIP